MSQVESQASVPGQQEKRARLVALDGWLVWLTSILGGILCGYGLIFWFGMHLIWFVSVAFAIVVVVRLVVRSLARRAI